MSDFQKIDATVFVYRHRHTGNISAHYRETALNFEEDAEWVHIATLNPRAWIEFNYSVAEQRDELLAALKLIIENDGAYGSKRFDAQNLCKGRDLAFTAIAKVESEK